jgi:hypothetical protein
MKMTTATKKYLSLLCNEVTTPQAPENLLIMSPAISIGSLELTQWNVAV